MLRVPGQAGVGGIMMKKNLRILYLWVVLALAAGIIPLPATAEPLPARVDCAQVPLDGEWHDYDLKKDTYAWCPLQLDSNGRLNLSVQTRFETDGSYYIVLLDKNCETICRTCPSSRGAADPTVWTAAYDLTAGQYFVRMESWNDLCGPFRVKADFTPSKGAEQTGAAFETAAKLPSPQTRGFLSSKLTDAFYAETLPADSQNFADCFMIDVETDRFDFSVTPVDPESDFGLTIYDSDYQQVTREYNNPVFSIDLTAGTYYLCVEADGHLCGDYLLKVDWAGRAGADAETIDNNTVGIEAENDTALQELSIPAGTSCLLADGDAEKMNLRWGSTDPQVAVVSQDGMIIGMSVGVAYIAAVPEDGSIALVYRVTVQ